MSGPGGVSRNEMEARIKRLQADIRRLLAESEGRVHRQVTVQVASRALDQASTSVAEALAAHIADEDAHPQYATYVHTQGTAASVWTVTHNLGRYPSVTVVDSANTEVVGDVTYLSDSQIEITFRSAFSGKAYLN